MGDASTFTGYCRACDAKREASPPWPGTCTACGASLEASAVADVLAPGLRVLFVGINPGVQTARAGHHFANPRNDFWRLLHEAGFTPRRFEPAQERSLLTLGLGITNVVSRATPGSGDVTVQDVRHGRDALALRVQENAPAWLAFVGKQAYQMATGERARGHGPGARRVAGVPTFVLPSTSPANAAVPYAQRLKWFRALREASSGSAAMQA